MNNFTIEDYKEAIRARYEIASKQDASGILSNPTPAELRDFYLRIFEKGNLLRTDKEIMDVFFGVKENLPLKLAIEICNTGKLKSIIYFLEGRNTNNRRRIEMIAILVDFKPRPFIKFQENNGIIEDENSKDEEYFPEPIKQKEDKKEYEEEKIEEQNQYEENPQTNIVEPKSILEGINKKLKWIITGIIIIFGLGFLISHYIFPKKQCMQWTGDHYEKVDCVQEINSFISFNTIKPFDEVQFKLKKINVCDTTTCFKNEQAIIWYGKISNQVDFFNMNGLNPLNGKPLRPITDHMFHKYKGDCKTKKSGSAK